MKSRYSPVNYKLATTIGQPSAGTNGDVNRFTLPGTIQVFLDGSEARAHSIMV